MTRRDLEDALASVFEKVAMGVSFGAACEDVCAAYGMEPIDLEEWCDEQVLAERQIAMEEGADR